MMEVTRITIPSLLKGRRNLTHLLHQVLARVDDSCTLINKPTLWFHSLVFCMTSAIDYEESVSWTKKKTVISVITFIACLNWW